MPTSCLRILLVPLLAVLLLIAPQAFAEEDYDGVKEPPSKASDREKEREAEREKERKKKRKYMIADPDRVDAGVFHVGFAVGGNFYIEPQVASGTLATTGDYFKDFGFQGGVYFHYDYSALSENVPLALRGMIGYKRILDSTNVFAIDAMVRWMFRFSEHSTFGLGAGTSASVWFREQQSGPVAATEEIIFLPSFLLGAGFEYNPFMVDFKFLVNRFGEDSTILGLELYFGFRL